MGKPSPKGIRSRKQSKQSSTKVEVSRNGATSHQSPERDKMASDSAKNSGYWDTSKNFAREAEKESVASQVQAGKVPILVSPDKIEDHVGSDRERGWENDEEQQSLLENIDTYGQQQPISVRALVPNWTPLDDNPLAAQPNDRFALRSGRRRLLACKTLGMDVYAFVSPPDGDVELQDLQERFYENVLHKRLTGLEHMRSVGQMALKMEEQAQSANQKKPTQAEIAIRIGAGVKQPDISVAKKIAAHYEFVREKLGADARIDDLRALVPSLSSKAEQDSSPQASNDAKREAASSQPNKPEESTRSYSVGGGASLRHVRGGKGLTLKVNRGKLDDSKWRKLQAELEKVIRKFEDEGPE